jgi:isopentenyl-diphosphate delta-isomerase
MPANDSIPKQNQQYKSSSQTVSRKKDHVDLCVGESVVFKQKTTGLEDMEFVHNALPEINLADVETETTFLEKSVSMPLMVSCMTGGYDESERINRELAEVCEEYMIPMGVGSQRQALENTTFHETFRVARQVAPSIPIVANIGGAQIVAPATRHELRIITDLVEADALTVHVNPLQELMQPEGTPQFQGVLEAIEIVVQELEIPVIVKEVGAGISGSVAQRLLDIGVSVIDTAGAGGTSWAGVELLRHKNADPLMSFWDWGLPTRLCVQQIAPLKKQYDFTLVASGGISNGVDAAKAITLGADIVAMARPVITVLQEEGQNQLREFFQQWRHQLRGAMFLTGSRTLSELRSAEYYLNNTK